MVSYMQPNDSYYESLWMGIPGRKSRKLDYFQQKFQNNLDALNRKLQSLCDQKQLSQSERYEFHLTEKGDLRPTPETVWNDADNEVSFLISPAFEIYYEIRYVTDLLMVSSALEYWQKANNQDVLNSIADSRDLLKKAYGLFSPLVTLHKGRMEISLLHTEGF